MAWTYDATKLTNTTPSSTYPPTTLGERYQVRMLIQDVNSAKPLFQDEEIDFAMTTAANVYTCAADLCDLLVSKAGGVKSKKISEFSITYDVEMYRRMSGTIRARGMGHQIPYAGGISISDKQHDQGNTDAVQPRFTIKQGDNPQGLDPSVNSSNPLTQI